MAYLKKLLSAHNSNDDDRATIVGRGNYVNVFECKGLVLCELYMLNELIETHYLERFSVLNKRDFDEVRIINLHDDFAEVVVTTGKGEYTPSQNGAEVKLGESVDVSAVFPEVQNVAVQGGVPIDTSGGAVPVQIAGNQGVTVNNAVPIDTSGGAVEVQMSQPVVIENPTITPVSDIADAVNELGEVEILAGATVQVLPANTNRIIARIWAGEPNLFNLRVGYSNQAATLGGLLAPGGVATDKTKLALWVHNPSDHTQWVRVTEEVVV